MQSRRSALAVICCLPLTKRPAQGATLTIPARVDNQGRFIIEARIDGKPLACEIDTGGADQIYVSRKRAAEMKIVPEYTGRSAGPGDRSLATDYRAKVTLGVGQTELPGRTLVIKEHFFDDIGVIGAKVFETAVIEFDYARPALSFHPRATFRYEGPGQAFPFTLWSSNPHVNVDITLSGVTLRARMTVDTGATRAAAFITPAFDERLRSAGHALDWKNDDSGRKFCRIDKLAIGPFAVEKPLLRLLPNQGFGGADGAPDALLGVGFLRVFRFFLDYSKQQLILEPGT